MRLLQKHRNDDGQPFYDLHESETIKPMRVDWHLGQVLDLE